MRILSLDIATACGWAYDCPPEPGDDPAQLACGVRSGTVKLQAPAGDMGGGFENGRTFKYFDEWLSDFVSLVRPDVLVFEAPLNIHNAFTSENTVRLLFGLAAIAELVATRYGLQRFEANNATVRKHFLGSARGKSADLKLKTMARCRALGWYPKDHNEADAIALHDYARHAFRLPANRPAGPLFKKEAW